ncbi:hypothetical protein KCU73_g2259, partial [Aureobasidium melanogenum]
MGASLSSPQLGNGLISAPGPDAPGPFATAFYVAATDTSSLGFTASVYWGTAMEARYTDTAGVERTVGCSDSPDPDPNQRNPFSVSILCPVANTQLGTGPVIFSLAGDGPATYAIFVGQTTATVGPDPITTTAIVPDGGNHHNTYWAIFRITLSNLANYLTDDSIDINEKCFYLFRQLKNLLIDLTLKYQLTPCFFVHNLERAIISSDRLSISFHIDETELCVVHQDQQIVIPRSQFELH